jgi:cytochrome c-type biogenesis protein CcmH
VNGFWIGALTLGVIAAMVVITPIVLNVARNGDTRRLTTVGVGVVAALALPVAALGLYAHWNNYDWTGEASLAASGNDALHAMDDAVQTLRDRLAANPNDAEGWQLLGRTYMTTQNFSGAANSFSHAIQVLGPEAPTTLRADYAEALVFTQEDALQGGSKEVFEAVIEEDPDNPKALWYLGLAAAERGDMAVARARWEPLLELDPPEQVVRIINERLGMEPAAAGASQVAAVAAAPAAEAASEPAPVPEAPPPPEGAIQLQISVDPGLETRMRADAPLFIFARSGAGGPPLAVVRQRAADLPLVVNLSDENTMIEGTSLADHSQLTLVARVSLAGGPGAQPGDLFGEVLYDRNNGQTTQIRIDQVVQ